MMNAFDVTRWSRVIDRFDLYGNRSVRTLDLTKIRTPPLSMLTRAPFVVVTGGFCGEGTTMPPIGTRAERTGAEKLAICI